MGYNPYGAPVLRIDDTSVQHTSKNRVKTSTFEIIAFNSFQYTKDEDLWDEAVTGTVSDTLTIEIASVNANKSGFASINWIEIR